MCQALDTKTNTTQCLTLRGPRTHRSPKGTCRAEGEPGERNTGVWEGQRRFSGGNDVEVKLKTESRFSRDSQMQRIFQSK